jgi:hypothetical protein
MERQFRALYSKIASPTRAFARVIGPWLVIVPGIIVLRASGISALASDFFKNGLLSGSLARSCCSQDY